VYIPAAPAKVRAAEGEGVGGRRGKGGGRVPRVACTTRFPGIALIVGGRKWGRNGGERKGGGESGGGGSGEGRRGTRGART
jgi:hypothetical protein